jgi:Regulator of ribonuclease activity B
MQYPNDADGQALAAIASSGMDMTTPTLIEFAIDVLDESAGNAVLNVVSSHGYQTELYYDEGEPDYQDGDDEEFGPSWTVYAVAQMQPTYENVVGHQARINELVAEIGGNCDAWEVKLK